VRFRQSQTEQKAAWGAAHSGNVAERSGEALPSRRVRRVLVPREMRSFEKPVAGENCLVARLWTEEGRVVSDSQNDRFCNSPAPRRSGAVRNLSEDGVFVLRFSRHRVVRELQSTSGRQYNWLIPYLLLMAIGQRSRT
jgi:hypothetical protein